MFPKAMDDGLQVYAVDQLDLSADEAKAFARRCHEVDNQNQQYDLSAQRMSGGQHPVPSLKARLEKAMGQVAGEVHRKQQHDLANSSPTSTKRNPFGLPTGVPGAQRLPSAGVKVVGRGEGGGSVPPVPNNATGAFYNSPGAPAVTSLPNNDVARYVRPGTNEMSPLPGNPQPPAQPQPSPQDNAGGQNLDAYDGVVMGTDGQMRNVSQMNDAELEAARQMHVGLGNSREVQVISFEQQRRANNTQTGPQGYA
jgi:hypothetical protein